MPTACCMSARSDLQLLGFRATASDPTFLPRPLLTAADGASGWTWTHLTLQADSVPDDAPRCTVEGE
jgi:hypothetical protein